MTWSREVDASFIRMARERAKVSGCLRGQVGAVGVAADGSWFWPAHNASLTGETCRHACGCDMVDGHCARTLHAEAAVVALFSRGEHSLRGGVVYTTHYPCWPCFKLLIAAGVRRVVWVEAYRQDPRVESAARAHHVQLEGWVDG